MSWLDLDDYEWEPITAEEWDAEITIDEAEWGLENLSFDLDIES